MLTDVDELSRRAVTGDGRGGKRPGAGRPRKDGSQPQKVIPKPDFEVRTPEEILLHGTPPPLVTDGTTDMGAIDFTMPNNPVALFAGAKARKEAAHAAKAELEYRVKAGMYLPREAVRSAMATAFQAVAQSLRSIPDNLERKLGVTPELAEAVGVSIDEAMGDLAHELEQIFIENNALSRQD